MILAGFRSVGKVDLREGTMVMPLIALSGAGFPTVFSTKAIFRRTR
jgi:hypothetical protein